MKTGLFDSFHPWERFVSTIGFTGPIVGVSVLLVDALLSRILARELKATLRLSASLGWIYLVITLARCFTPGAGDIETVFQVIGAIALSLATAQTLFVVIVDFVIGRNGRRPLQPMLRYALLGLVFVVAGLAGLRAGGVTTVGVLASGAVAVGGLGAALAEMLRQVGSGVMVQYARPFEVGDVILVAGMEERAAVVQTSWRTTMVNRNDGVEMLVPNSEFVTHTVVNFGRGDRVFRRGVLFEANYETPPALVQSVVLQSIVGLRGVETEPPPEVLVEKYGESGIVYELRLWTRRALDYERVESEARSRIWYAFARAGLTFPFPTRTLHLAEKRSRADLLRSRIARLRSVSLFAHVTEEALTELAEGGREAQYGSGEAIVVAGEHGREMFLLLEGEVSVVLEGRSNPSLSTNEPNREITRLGVGEFFGEMSLLTGAPRSATVLALGQTRTFVLDERNFRVMLERHPEVAEAISEELAARSGEIEAASVALAPEDRASRLELKGAFLARIKKVFGFLTKN